MVRKRKHSPSAWQPVAFVIGGLPVAIAGGVFAYAMSKATAQSAGVVVIPVWFLFSLGVIAIAAGAFDLARGLACRLSGRAVPDHVATTWVRNQTGLT